MSIGNYKLQQKCDITTHLLEWLKSKTLTTPIAGQDGEQQEVLFIAGRNAKCTVTLEDSLAVSTKLAIRSSNCAPWFLLKGFENLCPHEILYVVVYSSFINNYPNLEATKMCFNTWNR